MNYLKSFSSLAAIVVPVIFVVTSIMAIAGENHSKPEKTDLAHIESARIESSQIEVKKTEPEHSDANELHFTAKQMQLANINIEKIKPRYMDKRLYAPGEIQANGYTSYVVSPRVESVIVKRHAILGEHVNQGQALVTLFSEAVAEAQALYRIRYADWQRAKKVGNKVISESQLLTAETDYFAAFGRLKAYGLTNEAINDIANKTSASLGEYTLKAEREGLVLSDDFQQGQRIAAGDAIMLLSDENELWVEARLAANNSLLLNKGTKAQLMLAGSDVNEQTSYQAEVIQQGHTIDAKTRTRIVRLKVNNTDHQLHPGLFVDVYFSVLSSTPILAVPETALTQGVDGDWLIYLASKDKQKNDSDEVVFKAQEVELGSYYQQFSEETQLWQSWREISLAKREKFPMMDETTLANSELNIAITGAFFIASQSAKSGFDTHNH